MTIRKFFAIAAATAIVLIGSSPANVAATSARIQNVPAPQGKKWSQVGSKTPSLGYIMGNPNAPVKIVEYGSLTCIHCRHFEEAAFPKLVDTYVDSGRVSFEFRNYTLNVVDVPTGILTRCKGPASYFKLSNAVFANQDKIISGVQNTRKEVVQGALDNEDSKKFVQFAKVTGITAFFTQHGLSQEEATACLANPAKLRELLALNQFATDRLKVDSTPTFFVNGSRIVAGTWPQVEAKLIELGVK